MREILIETKRFGAVLKVSAVDAATGTEISFQAPATSSRADLQALAAGKLDYVMRKSKN